jgi:general secretion pathway protein A
VTLWEEKLGKDYRLEIFLGKWGLHQDPFTPELPTPEAFVPVQKEDLLRLKQLLLEGRVGILTGGLGMGKTTVCEFLTATLREESILTEDPEKQAIPVLIHGAAYKSVDELLRAIILALELDANRDRASLFEILRRWGIEHREKLAVIIDDVPESTADFQEIGEFLRVLADLPNISILFNGEYKQMRKFLEKVPALRDRIHLHVMLKTFDAAAVRELLQFRLRFCGYTGSDGLITPDGFESIYRISKGVPRLVLKVASRSLRRAAELDTLIDAEVVKKANRRSFLRRIFGAP